MRKNFTIYSWVMKSNLLFVVIIFTLVIILINNLASRRHYIYDFSKNLQDDYIAQWEAADPRLIEHIQKYYLIPPASHSSKYNLDRPEAEDWSQKGQPKVVAKILSDKKHGFFVEAGAMDGELWSNTLYLEKNLNWTGLLVEPDYANFRRMVDKNRKAWLAKACLDGSSRPTKHNLIGGGLIGAFAEHMPFGVRIFTRFWQPLYEQSVWCFPLRSLLIAVNCSRVDYFSLDIEGGELEVLESIKKDSLDITVFQLEFIVFKVSYIDKDRSNHRKNMFRDYVKEQMRNYREKKVVLYDIIFAKTPIIDKL